MSYTPDASTNAPRRFRKKPVEVEAMGPLTPGNRDAIAAWCGGKAEEKPLPGPGRGITQGIVIRTLEGTMSAPYGWWIIRGIEGEFYPCRGDIFAATYEEVPR